MRNLSQKPDNSPIRQFIIWPHLWVKVQKSPNTFGSRAGLAVLFYGPLSVGGDSGAISCGPLARFELAAVSTR